MAKARLEELYTKSIRPSLQKKLGKKNIMQVPKLDKIVVNIGVKEAVSDSRILQKVVDTVQRITGQLPVKTVAKKSIAGFKLREGMPLGVKVTLRRQKMYEFLDKTVNLALPKVRDFQGVGTKLDGRGNYNLGIKEWSVFPEADTTNQELVLGMNITFHMNAASDQDGRALLEAFGMPFKKS
ncbi:MAG: 50S ribosomal protein L5 [Candidatus Babeliales bacterium]